MGIVREHNGYSAHIEGYLVVGNLRFRLALTNGVNFLLAEDCELEPGTNAELLVIIDGEADTRRIELPDGVALGQRRVRYQEAIPF